MKTLPGAEPAVANITRGCDLATRNPLVPCGSYAFAKPDECGAGEIGAAAPTIALTVIGTPKTFARRLLDWYDRSRRHLPWRLAAGAAAPGAALDPYHVLVSEAMLQQTQVATVIPYYERFIKRFPTLAALAEADEQDVLRLWQGLGYYSRARNLQAAARAVVARFGGRLPQTVEELLTLPGVGRYTAGAVASIAFDRRAPIVDGNVARVLCRIDQIESDPRDKPTQEILWARAEQILPSARLGDFNSALMELGALVCTPRAPQCLICPVRAHCEAFAAGVQEQIPPPRRTRPTPLLRRSVLCVRRPGSGNHETEQWLIEQRPPTGRWAGMWQFVTFEANGAEPSRRAVREHLSFDVDTPRLVGIVRHALTHRRYEFDVYVCTARTAGNGTAPGPTPRAWVTRCGLDAYPLPRPHLKIIDLLMSSATRPEPVAD
jgi:A/G-specific adenine glycosylase